MMSFQNSALPSSLPCPHCKTRIDLDEGEQHLGAFICPVCSRKTNGLLAFWIVQPEVWREKALKRFARRLVLPLVILAGFAVYSSVVDKVPYGLLTTIAFAWPIISLIRTGLDYFKYARTPGWAYIYQDGISGLYGEQRWQSRGKQETGTQLHGIEYEEPGVLIFRFAGLWNDDIVVPVPYDCRAQAERVVQVLVSSALQ